MYCLLLFLTPMLKNGKSDGDANEKTDAESSTQLQSTSSEIGRILILKNTSNSPVNSSYSSCNILIENSQTVSDFKPEGLKNRIKSLEESVSK